MWNLTRNELLTPLTPKQHPEFFRLLLPGEEMGRWKMLPEQIMPLRWANHHIRQYLNDNPDQKGVPKDFKISNLDSDLADGKRIDHPAPSRPAPRRATSALKMNWNARPRQVIDDAKRIGVDKFEVAVGHHRRTAADVPRLPRRHHQLHPALEPVQGFDLSDIMAGEAGDDARSGRSGQGASLGLNHDQQPVRRLAERPRHPPDGRPPRAAGCVDLVEGEHEPQIDHDASRTATTRAPRRSQDERRVGIGGKDIAEGSIKLTLAVVGS